MKYLLIALTIFALWTHFGYPIKNTYRAYRYAKENPIAQYGWGRCKTEFRVFWDWADLSPVGYVEDLKECEVLK